MKKEVRLIDANKLRKDVLDLLNCYNGFSDTYDKALIIALVDDQPTVDVVRCKDCRLSTVTELRELYCYRLEDIVGAKDYCSKGERRKDG
jgi:hypothetical protein